jgi:hypothetical protein
MSTSHLQKINIHNYQENLEDVYTDKQTEKKVNICFVRRNGLGKLYVQLRIKVEHRPLSSI